MSGIIVTLYTGDAEHFRDADPDSKGAVDEVTHYTDGEELQAAADIVQLLSQTKQFDVRQWVD